MPSVSVRVEVTTHVPSLICGRLHESTPDAATKVQVTVVAPFVALTVTVWPSETPATVIVGVLSEVTSSLVRSPVSDAVARSGVDGAEMADTVTDTVEDERRFSTSATEYVAVVTTPVNPPVGEKRNVPTVRSTVHSPFPVTVRDVAVQFGAVSPAPQSDKDAGSRPVPVSFANGEITMSSSAGPEPVSLVSTAAAAAVMVAVILPVKV